MPLMKQLKVGLIIVCYWGFWLPKFFLSVFSQVMADHFLDLRLVPDPPAGPDGLSHLCYPPWLCAVGHGHGVNLVSILG